MNHRLICKLLSYFSSLQKGKKGIRLILFSSAVDDIIHVLAKIHNT